MQDDFEAFARILDGRFSCRGYLETEVEADVIEEIVQTASKAPTWCNAQPWNVLVTRGAATKSFGNALTQAAENSVMAPDFDWPTQYTGDYQERRKTCGYQLYEALGIARGDREGRKAQMMENFRFFGAPHVAIITTEADLGPYGAMDCGGFIALFTLAAQAKGLATVVQASVSGYAPTVRQHFGIPENRLIQAAISFGFKDPAHPSNGFRTNRADVDDVLTVVTGSQDIPD